MQMGEGSEGGTKEEGRMDREELEETWKWGRCMRRE